MPLTLIFPWFFPSLVLGCPEKCFIPKIDEKLVSSKDQSFFRDNNSGKSDLINVSLF